MHREGKPKGVFYLDHRTIDGKHNLITDTYVTAGNIHDSRPYMARLKRLLERFGFNPVGVGLDAGYFTAPICYLLLAEQIYPVLGYRHHHCDVATCKVCPLLSQCTQSKNTQKVITHHIWEADKEKANEIRLSQWGKKVYARRKETIERSFADAKQHHGHRYARFRRRTQVQMQCLLAATVQNIKKIAIKLFLLRFLGYFLIYLIKSKLKILFMV
ncbi:hypothetical protein A9G25_00120 [Gilliamella sp. Bif1-4]|nr:hypothetical protein A9G25_00120 [Gilliamella apicola]